MKPSPVNRLGRLGRTLVEGYASADPRSLGVFRIALGMLLFGDVLRRAPDLDAHYSNAGWLTNHYALFRPMSDHLFSLYYAFSTPGEVRTLFALHLLVNLLFIIGWHTRLMHVLAALFITSLNSRTILLENGGWVVLNLLTVWSMFLPCGRRFSVDAFVRSWRSCRERSTHALNDRALLPRDRAPVISLAVTALILQWIVIYSFNVVHKNGPPWRDGTAVYYFFQQDRMVTSFGAWLREVLSLDAIKFLTWSTLGVEALIAFLLVLPFATHVTRMLAWALVCALHLSIDAVVQLGPFSWAMLVMFFALIPGRAWDALERRQARKKPLRRLVYDAHDGASIDFCRLVNRLDLYGRVRFIPLACFDPEHARFVALPSGITPESAASSLLVMDEAGSEFWVGSMALRRLSDALPLGWLAAFTRLLLVRDVLDRLIAKAVRERNRLSHWFELDNVPAEADWAALEAAPARQFFGRLKYYALELCVALVMVALASQVLIENRAVPLALKPRGRPEWMASVVVYPRLFQGWSMFAPSPPAEDGRIVVDGRTVHGEKLDPLTGLPPSFEVESKAGFGMNQIWGDFHRRIAEPRFETYRPGLRDFLERHHELTGRPEQRLVAFDVWYVSESIPPPGQPKQPPSRQKLFSHGLVR